MKLDRYQNWKKSNASSEETFAARGRSDFFSTNFKIALANANTSSPFREKYLKSIICNRELTKEDNKITGIYCSQRWCITCNRIRTAELINRYLGQIEAMEDAHFVTLTLKNCKAEELQERNKLMLNVWAQIQKKLYKQGNAIGFRKIEITYNQRFDDYHPHFHAIINGKNKAEFIVNEWINLITKAGIEVNSAWQDIRQADSKAAKELMKYTTKLLPSKKKGQTWEELLQQKGYIKKFLQSQDIIFRSLENLRTFQYFGFKRIKEQEETPDEAKLQTEAQEYSLKIPDGKYLRDGRGNWIHTKYNFRIHNRPITEKLIQLVNLVGCHYIKPIQT